MRSSPGRTLVFAYEPTGNLDSRSGAEVLGFLRASVRELGQTVVMVTHDPVAASYADRVLFPAEFMALLAVVIGVGLGAVFGWAMADTFIKSADGGVISIPFAEIGLFVAIGAMADAG